MTGFSRRVDKERLVLLVLVVEEDALLDRAEGGMDGVLLVASEAEEEDGLLDRTLGGMEGVLLVASEAEEEEDGLLDRAEGGMVGVLLVASEAEEEEDALLDRALGGMEGVLLVASEAGEEEDVLLDRALGGMDGVLLAASEAEEDCLLDRGDGGTGRELHVRLVALEVLVLAASELKVVALKVKVQVLLASEAEVRVLLADPRSVLRAGKAEKLKKPLRPSTQTVRPPQLQLPRLSERSLCRAVSTSLIVFGSDDELLSETEASSIGGSCTVLGDTSVVHFVGSLLFFLASEELLPEKKASSI